MAEKREVGRPTKYKEEYNDIAYRFCLLGHTDEELADLFDVSVSTLNLWKKEYPEFSLSINNGKDIADVEVVESLYKSCFDKLVPEQVAFKVKEVIYSDDGKRIKDSEHIEVVEVAKGVPADFRSMQFWLKNRQAKKWRDKQEQEISVSKETELIIKGQKFADKD